jgi:5S rRNA maturation endonuclease (ribonuclease M5)
MGQIKYQYNDGNGRLLYTVVKFPNKEFRRLRTDSQGKDHWNWDGIKQVPYRWPDIKDHRAVIFVEGEKDVDNLQSIDLVSTTIAGGSNAWTPLLKKQPDFPEKYFSGFDQVFIIPDNDEAGRKFAQETGEHIREFVSKIWIVNLPDLEKGGDVSDYLSQWNEVEKDDLKSGLLQTIEEFKSPFELETSALNLSKSWHFDNLNVDEYLTESERSESVTDIIGIHDRIISQLKGVSWSGKTANAICPTHDDRKASLSVTLEADKILMRCHSGCDINTICDSLGVKVSELFVKRSVELRHHQKAHVVVPKAEDMEELCNSLLKNEEPGEFDDTHIPPILRDHVREACELTEASSAIIYGTSLSCLGAHAGTKLTIQPPNYFIPLYGNLWCLSISESGSFKTTALNAGSARLKDREEKLIYEVRDIESRIESLRSAGMQDGEDELMESLNELERYRSMRRVLPNKASWEACIDRIDETGGGVWLLSEFGAWLATLETAHNRGFRQHLTELYDVPAYFEDVTRTRGSKILRNPFVSISGVSTMEFLQGLLGKDDAGSGFLARFLLFKPPVSDNIPNALPQKNTKIQELHSYRLLSEIYNQLDNISVPLEYSLSADAQKLFEDFHNDMFSRFQDSNKGTKSILDPFLKRWSPNVLKSAILFQYLLDSETQTISDSAIMGGISLSLYAEKCTRYLFDRELGESVHQSKQRKLIEYLAGRGGAVTRRQLLSSRLLDGGHNEYDYVIESLEQGGRVHMERTDNKIVASSRIILMEQKK